jgi:anaerobic selenocysteine-containing dehydrogenase
LSDASPPSRPSPWELAVAPPPDRWDDWTELDGRRWPEQVERRYRLVPTICFNCESACGLLAYLDRETGEVVKFEGNPLHPGSRGRTCAKGPATINQVKDPERILHPLRRVGPRGGGRFERATWEEALGDIGERIRRALDEDRRDEVLYHVGRPGDDHFMTRLLAAWGVDGHQSHTNVCSSSARAGYALWCGADRPSPDFTNSRFLLLLSSHLESGHYFNPHAQRIVEAREKGARMAVVDPRLSNTASRADLWIAAWPGSEAALLLGVAHRLLAGGGVDRDFLERWTNWREYLAAHDPRGPGHFQSFLDHLTARYAGYSPEYVSEECRVPPETVERLAAEIVAAGRRFSSHLWRGAASGNLGGWQVARALLLLHVLTGSYGCEGGWNPNEWDKFVAKPSENPPPVPRWNELTWPREWPLAHYEMSFLLPHLLREQGKRLAVYFTRVYNPVWTNPDGCSWIRMLEDEDRVGCHVALTPTWSETAQWADWILPMGLGPERHDVMSQETHAGAWIGFRQPVGREFRRRAGEAPVSTLGTNPGEVWEEAEFWIALTWRIDPDGSRGIRRWYESKARPGEAIGLEEYYEDLFAQVPGLGEAAAKENCTPLDYLRRHGAHAVPAGGRERHAEPGADGAPRGFPTPSGKLEVHSTTLAGWGHAPAAVPTYERSHVHWRHLDLPAGERVLLPTFRLPTLIHTRSGNAKWLQEISHTNPLWISPEDAARLRVATGDLVRVQTAIGYFVPRVWVTEGIRPGVVACSHHLGRWRLHPETGARQSTALVDVVRKDGTFHFRQREGVGSFASADPDTDRIWWSEVGVHQNLAFPVQPDPVSGMHCWHQRVKVVAAEPDDRFGDLFVDTARSVVVYEEWRAKCTPGPGPDGLRRPLWLKRPLRPTDAAYRVGESPPGSPPPRPTSD